MAYAFGLPAFVGLKLTQSALYAMDKGRFVLLTSSVSVALNICLSLVLMQIYQHVGLALATSLVSWLAFIWQAAWLAQARRLDGASLMVVLKAAFASGIMAAGLYAALPGLQTLLSSDLLLVRFIGTYVCRMSNQR